MPDSDFLEVQELCPAATAMGLNLPADLPMAQWLEIGRVLCRAEDQLQWWIGDWWASGGHKYGRRSELAPDLLPVQIHTAENYASVSRAFAETSRRQEVLSFSHHQTVAHESRERADELLAWCLEPVAAGGGPRSRRELRERQDELHAQDVAAWNAKRAQNQAAREAENPPLIVRLEISRSDPAPPIRIVPLYPDKPAPQTGPVEARLDTSAGGGPVPDALRDLRVEPIAFDRVAAARAALAALSFAEALQVYCEWLQSLSAEERSRVRSGALGRGGSTG